MSNGSMATRFRVKKLSPRQPLPIYTESQLLDLADPDNIIQRAVPQIETGVEKEEEEEHDLQAAISAAQAAVTTGDSVQTYIPTPDASNVIDPKEFSKLYKGRHKEPSSLIKFSLTVEEVTGSPYVMDEEDDAYFKKHRDALSLSEDEFEKLMWEFESITDRQLPHLYLDVSHIPEYEEFLCLVTDNSIVYSWSSAPQLYEHWKERRIKRGGKSVIPALVYEDILKHEIDPYVCFRRRETKPVRKTRRSDQQSIERLRKLRTEMEMARNLLEMVLQREKIRKEGLLLEHSVFNKLHGARQYQRALNIKDDDDLNQILLPKRKRKTATENISGSGTTIKIPLSRLRRDATGKLEKSPLQKQMEMELRHKRERDASYEDVTECPYQPFPKLLPTTFFQQVPSSVPSNYNLTLSTSSSTTGPQFRRRLGRGGRIFVDRVGFRSRKALQTAGGKTREYPDYLHADFENEDSDYEYDVMNSALLQQRASTFDEQALRSLVTIPFTQTFPNNVTVVIGRDSHHQKPHDQHQQSQRAALQNANTNSTLSLSTGCSTHSTASTSLSPILSSSAPLKHQNSNNNQMVLQQTAAQVAPREPYTSNDADINGK
ncbi:enhancer of polycomb-like-domain-containing protein [Absidia repens]|uniref:Enhancer of polycomb-like protein n=1 Tax=Absidia repens TaxID=90262 RepID=A0A1X2IRJ2_9FUNG|nr:enhancer of polycomb-like-domain-containing protein [Absidia repens]